MYVILQPNSNTNRSDKYAVVEYSDWLDYSNGMSAMLAPLSLHGTRPEAQRVADEMNEATRVL